MSADVIIKKNGIIQSIANLLRAHVLCNKLKIHKIRYCFV